MDPSSLHHPNGNSLGIKNQDCNAGRFPFTNEDRTMDKGLRGELVVSHIARPATQLRDHVTAERKWRENLNLLFVAFSAVLPSLKKVGSIYEASWKFSYQLEENSCLSFVFC